MTKQINIDRKQIEKRKKTLEACRKHLKKEFIGIDSIIDNFLDYIQVWYLLPDVLSRPVVVNLWGMTGVGKTDLVRKMVKFLDFYDRFTEVELSNVDQSSWHSSVFNVLDDAGLNDGKPAIVLFDEIQRFNTLEPDGGPIQQTKFMDFWELLSDGRLSKKKRYDVDYYLLNALTKKKEAKRRRASGEEDNDEKEYLSAWEIQEFQKNLGLDMNADKMADMTEDDMFDIFMKSKQEKKIYEPINHSKTLIIISGNLDEAFRMANQTSEADVDADIFHAFTKKITLVDIKNALSRKFRPEQVARFGNIHLIYTSLQREEFDQLIEREISRIKTQTKKQLGIKLHIDKSINRLIYRNGVFPVQGVRPVFSSVSDILETNLSKYLFSAIMNEQKRIEVSYDETAHEIIANIGTGKHTEKMVIPFVGRIDKIRDANEVNTVANISVHESGHAVVYMLLMGLVPLQLKSKVASSYAGGFTFPHQVHETKANIINKVKIFLAGGLAEEVIFGADNASIGRSNDREQATMLLIDYVRKYGFDEQFQSVYTLEDHAYRMDGRKTDLDIETMMAQLLVDTKALLMQHTELLKALSVALSIRGSMDGTEIATIAKQFNVSAAVKEEGYLHIGQYHEQMTKQ